MASSEKHSGAHVNKSLDIDNAINFIGFGPFQTLMLFMTGGVMFSEGAEMLVMGSITMLLHDHWGLNAFVRGMMVSIVFVGFSVGNFLSGPIGDGFGRRRGIILSYALIGICGFATAGAYGPFAMVCIRFIVGVGCGIGFPTVYTLIPEVCPTHLRGSICTLMIGFMPLGELYAALGVLLIDPNLDRNTADCELGYYPSRGLANPDECSWKTLCEFSAIPAFTFLVFVTFLLYESPHYFNSHGHYAEAGKVLQSMAKCNRRDLDLAAYQMQQDTPDEHALRIPQQYSFIDAVKTMMTREFRITTLFMFFAHFTKDFSVFGLAYALPQYFKFLEGMSAGVQLCIVACLALPGVMAAFFVTLSPRIGHIRSITFAAASCLIFIAGMLEVVPDWISALCAYMVKLLSLAYFIFVVVYTAEVFPTNIRNTAVGMCTCVGRLGSISAPLLLELSLQRTKSFDIFMIMLFCLLANAAIFAPFCLTHETKGKRLVDHDPHAPDGAKETQYGSVTSKA